MNNDLLNKIKGIGLQVIKGANVEGIDFPLDINKLSISDAEKMAKEETPNISYWVSKVLFGEGSNKQTQKAISEKFTTTQCISIINYAQGITSVDEAGKH